MEFHPTRNGFTCKGEDPWYDLHESNAFPAELRGMLLYCDYESPEGYWLFEPGRSDARYSCRELLEIANKLSELNKTGVKP